MKTPDLGKFCITSYMLLPNQITDFFVINISGKNQLMCGDFCTERGQVASKTTALVGGDQT